MIFRASSSLYTFAKALRGDQEREGSSCEPTRLPSIQSPDICDYKVSPFSFVTPAALRLGNDCW